MGAFFSGTDDANENNSQFYAVWGKVEDEEPEIAFRYVVGNTKMKVSPAVLFNWPVTETITTTHTQVESVIHGDTSLLEIKSKEDTFTEDTKVQNSYSYIEGPFKQIEYPEEWLDQHEKEIPVYKTYTSYYGKGTKRTVNPAQETIWDHYDYGSQLTNKDKEEIDATYGYGAYEEDFQGYPNYDELNTLEVYPEKMNAVLVSPELALGVKELLEDIRAYYPELYEEIQY